MKCLVCARQLANTNDLREHYVTFHRVIWTIGCSKISWNVKMILLELENAYTVKIS